MKDGCFTNAKNILSIAADIKFFIHTIANPGNRFYFYRLLSLSSDFFLSSFYFKSILIMTPHSSKTHWF
jgi:hypothetical protein